MWNCSVTQATMYFFIVIYLQSGFLLKSRKIYPYPEWWERQHSDTPNLDLRKHLCCLFASLSPVFLFNRLFCCLLNSKSKGFWTNQLTTLPHSPFSAPQVQSELHTFRSKDGFWPDGEVVWHWTLSYGVLGNIHQGLRIREAPGWLGACPLPISSG
jgi:hypothetical protein